MKKHQYKKCKRRTIHLLYLAVLFFGIHTGAFAQSGKITVNVKDVPIRQFFNKIEEQSEYRFTYRDLSINDEGRITYSTSGSGEKVETLLQKTLTPLGLQFQISRNDILITRKIPLQSGVRSQNFTGVVADDKGEPIIGANIALKGSQTGTITDEDGKFSIEAPIGATLLVSYVGYTPKEVKLGENTNLQIAIQENHELLNEVVVIGYGTQKKVNLTGAVASINVEQNLKGRPVGNISSGLSGLVAGLDVRQSSGQPGKDDAAINIRGIGTLNNASPLILIDGLAGSIGDVNPSDIESVSVLKDASSAAIYGSRAANGVVLITTKKGEKGRVKITYNGLFSRQEATNLFGIISDYATTARLTNEGYDNINPGNIPVIPLTTIEAWENNRGELLYPNTNWLKTIFHPTWRKENNVSISGGNDAILYNIGLGALNNEGIMEGTGYDRYNVKINIESRINQWIKVGINSNSQFGTMDEPYEAGYIMANIAGSSPSALPLHPDGRFGSTMAQGEDNAGANMLAFNNARSVNQKSSRYMNKLFVEIEPVKNLVLEGNYGYINNTLFTKTELHYTPMWNFQSETIIRSPFPENILNEQMYRETLQTFYLTGRYNFSLNQSHNLKILGGFNTESYRSDYFLIGRGGMPDFDEFQLNLSSSSPWTNGNAQEYSLVSGFARLNYDYKGHYLFEANARMDGSSRFSAKKRWGTFPSVSLGWRISEENFIKDNISWLDNLKIRGSIGNLGNNNIGNNYSFASAYSRGNSQSYVFGGQISPGTAASSIPNKELTWEETTISNLGLDVAWLNSFDLSFDIYKRDTKGILIQAPVPMVLGGLSSPYQNLANLENRGWELTLNYNKKFINELALRGSFNISQVSNKIKKYAGGEPILGGNTIIGDGYAYGAYYGHICDGIFRTQSDIDNHAPQKYGNAPGDLMYRDISGPDGVPDGIVDDDDRTVIGKSTPDYVLGLTLAATYKHFDVSMLFQSLLGYDVWVLDTWNSPQVAKGRTYREIWLDRWTPDNPDASLPRLTPGSYSANSRSSDFWLQNADYLRLKNIQIGYTLPAWKALNYLGVEYFRFFISGENLLTFTKYDGLDPETAQLSAQRYETEVRMANNHPNVKQFTFGVNLKF